MSLRLERVLLKGGQISIWIHLLLAQPLRSLEANGFLPFFLPFWAEYNFVILEKNFLAPSKGHCCPAGEWTNFIVQSAPDGGRESAKKGSPTTGIHHYSRRCSRRRRRRRRRALGHPSYLSASKNPSRG